MKTIIAQTVLPEFRDNALEFTDVLSVADRMTGKKIISGEFIGKNLGWFRASFITIETDEKQRPLKVLFTTRSIDEDKKKEEQLILFSNTDELTGCYNRRAYEEDMTELLSKDEFIYVSMDVNGLKTVNDSMGHEAGDELLRGAAECMNNTFDKYGKVYRNGGDEFVAILNVGRDKYGEISQSFENAINNWTGNSVKAMTISCGYVMGDERSWGSNLEVAKLADDRMYRIKTEYYKELGIVRPERQNKYSVISKLYDIIERIELSENGIKKLMKDSQRIHPDDREKYMYKISLEYLRKYFSENNVLSIFYRVQTEDGYIPMIMDIIEADDYSEGAQSLYMYIRKCDDIRK